MDLAAAQAATGWVAGPRGALVFGYTRSAFWLRWRIDSTSSEALDLVVDLGSPRQDYVDWHLLRQDGQPAQIVRSGDRRPFRERPLPARDFALPLQLLPHEQVELYVRLASHDGLYEAMPVQLYERAAFFAEEERENLILTLYHGGLLALALYNLLLFAATRERAFGLYVGYMLSLVMWNFTFQGYAFKFLWPEATVFNNNVLTLTSAWAFAIFGLFAVQYLNMRDSVPRWVMRLNQVVAWTNMALVLPAAADWYAIGAAIGQVTGIAMSLASLATGVWLLRRGQRQAAFFVLAFGVLGVGITAYILLIVGVVPANAFTTWGLQVGSAFEALVLALGLADTMNTLKAQKLGAERRARETQQALNVKLEQQVMERTRALEQANERLLTLAVTDELTGAFNRRHFNSFCADAMANRRRIEPLALCMFDIDYFKCFNDRYGHQEGDTALCAVASAVQAELRRSGDALFRLGGEEFGVLFSAGTEAKASAFAERLRRVVRDQAIPHEASPAGVMTASFGVGWWAGDALAEATPEFMYAVVDRALYAAKAAGRDRVVMRTGHPKARESAAAATR